MPLARFRRARPVGFAPPLLVLLMLVALLLPPGLGASAAQPVAAAQAAGPGDVDPALYEAVLPGEREAVVAETAGRLSRYRIAADLVPATADRPGRVRGTLDLRYVNDTGAEVAELFFRLYANHPNYAEGGMTVPELTVGGEPVNPELRLDDTILRVPLPAALTAGAATDLALGFATTVPIQPAQSYGIFAADPPSGTLALAHWFPLLAGRDDAGWSLDPLSRNGDPIFSNVALFDVALTAPRDLVLVTSGRAIEETETGDRVRRRYVTGPVRDFTVVGDDDYAALSQQVDGTTVTSYFNPASADGGADVLRFGAQSLGLYNRLFGTYPYEELDLVQVDLQGAAGVEFPQLMLIGDNLYDPGRGNNADFLEFVVVHEVAHQWWYALVGNNQHRHAFIDEGLAEYTSSEIYFGEQYDAAKGRQQLDLEVTLRYLNYFIDRGDEVADQPTDDFPSGAAYNAVIYGKAALGFDALRAEIGDDAFFGGLRDYHRRFRFGVATPGDLRAALERAAGRDLGDLWRHWFEVAEGGQDFGPQEYRDLLLRLGLG